MPDRPPPDYWGFPPFGDGDLDAWLSGNTAAAPPAVDEALTALLAPPSRAELAGQPRALAEFRRARRASRRQLPVMWLASAAALIVLVCGAAAVTGTLPTPIQNIAHVVFAVQPTRSPRATASTGSPAHATPTGQPDSGTPGGRTDSPDRAPTPRGMPGPQPRSTPSLAGPHIGKWVFPRGSSSTSGSSPASSATASPSASASGSGTSGSGTDGSAGAGGYRGYDGHR